MKITYLGNPSESLDQLKKLISENDVSILIDQIDRIDEFDDDANPDRILVDLDTISHSSLTILREVQALQWDGLSLSRDKAYEAMKFKAADFWWIPSDWELLISDLYKDQDTSINDPSNVKLENDILKVKSISGKTLDLVLNDIVFVEANADLVYIHYYLSKMGRFKRTAIAQNLKFFEDSLDKERFFRSHRKYLVNRAFILPFGDYPKDSVDLLHFNQSLPLARRRKLEFNNWFKKLKI